MQDLYKQPISKLVEFIIAASHDNPQLLVEVFVHKAEKLQEDDKIGVLRAVPMDLFCNRLQRISGKYKNASKTT